ncbi:putative phosphatidylglycerol/phosphatidylinositol transfer protein DDB_G0282107 [Dysidea avara]|uniref:putative phosphatidylglycerol/phosphatidylinositol transfer protein DDB_G0282107 n=1 Tax=Dysidea avara TaxID=196820 RepID=UPI003325995F
MFGALKYSAWFTALFVLISANALIWKSPPQATCKLDSCGTSNDKVKDVHVTYSPHPPQVNKNVTIFFSGNLVEEVDKGEMSFKVTFNSYEVDRTLNLCHVLADANLTCPLHPGPFKFAYTVPVPPIVPRGKYGAVANATDENQNALFCLKGLCSVY